MYTKHFFLLIVIICSLIINVYSQKHVTPKNEQQFVFTCKKIAQALVNKDLQTLNAYINKNIGVDVMYGYGAYGGRLHLNKLISDTSLFSLGDYYDSIHVQFSKLNFVSKPTRYDCGTGWNQKGNFIDTSNTYKPISELVNFWKRSDLGTIKLSSAEISTNRKIEKNIRKIVFTNVGCCGMVFYMSFIDNKWYLTVIDQLETSCDV